MSTSKNFLMNKGMSYKVTAKARGYYDYSTILNPDGTAITYDMTPYDGLNYNVDLTYNAYRDATIDFSKTKLPYLGLVNQSLQTSEYCLRATGQNYDLKEYASKYTNVTVHGSPTIDNDVVSNFSSDNYLTIEKRSNTMTVVLKIITGSDLNTPQRILFLDKWVSFTLDGASFRVAHFDEGTEGPIGPDLSVNTEYVWKIVLNSDGSRVFSYSTDGGTNYTEAANFTDTGVNWSDSQANTFYLGINNTTTYPFMFPFKGKVDLSKSYIMEKLASGDFVGYNLNETTFESTGTTKSYAGIYDPDYTDTGTAKTLNCFSNGNQFVILSEKENYPNYTYLGTVTIPQHNIFTGGVTPEPSTPDTPTIDPSALKFGDRIDNKATVVGTFESSDLGTVVFAVLDSTYYGQHNWASGLNVTDTGLPNYATEDEALAAKESATYNTDYILNNYSNKATEAFTYCRSIEPLNFNGKKYNCQLPNAYELKQIYNNSEKLYELDPTTSTNTSYNLANWDFNGLYDIWSSNECTSDSSWEIQPVGALDNYSKVGPFGVIPIIEIPLKEV